MRKHKFKPKLKRGNPKPSRLIGPEDVRAGQYVTCAHRTFELFVHPCDVLTAERHLQPYYATVTAYDAGRALRVEAVCLPFVLVRDTHGRVEGLDLRQVRLARLSKAYGRAAFAAVARRPATP